MALSAFVAPSNVSYDGILVVTLMFGDETDARYWLAGLDRDETLGLWAARQNDRAVRCAVTPTQSPRSGNPAVLMEDSTQAVAALHPPGRERDYVGQLAGSALVYPLMRPCVEVVVDELGQHLLQVAAAKDEQMVQHLPPY